MVPSFSLTGCPVPFLRQFSVNLVSICSSRSPIAWKTYSSVFHTSAVVCRQQQSRSCSYLASLRAGLAFSMCVVSGCATAAAQSQRSELSEGAMYRIALCCLALHFVPPGLCPDKKAVAVVERTKEDGISCALMRGELSSIPSAALTGRALP